MFSLGGYKITEDDLDSEYFYIKLFSIVCLLLPITNSQSCKGNLAPGTYRFILAQRPRYRNVELVFAWPVLLRQGLLSRLFLAGEKLIKVKVNL